MTPDDTVAETERATHETRHSPAADTPPAVSVAAAVAAVRNEKPTELTPPLESVIDTDALTAHLEEAAADEALSFRYKDCSVRLYGDGRIVVDTEERPDPETRVPERIRDLVADRYVPGTDAEQTQRRLAILSAYRYLRERGSARRSDFIEEIYPLYPAGYSIPDGGWWETIVKPGLGDCPDVTRGNTMWYYVGE